MHAMKTPLVALVLSCSAFAATFSACSGGGTAGESSSSSSSGATTSSSSSSGNTSSSSSTGGASSSGGGTSSSSSTGGASGSSSSSTGGSSGTSSGGSSGGFNFGDGGFNFGDGGFQMPDGGFNIDAGFIPYSGARETGVVCSGVTCGADAGAICCVPFSLTGPPQAGTCADTCQSLQINAHCDGPEDCPTSGDVCCFNATFSAQGTFCKPAAECVSTGTFDLTTRICAQDVDCPAGWGCCQSQTLQNYIGEALDNGTCVEGCGL